MLTPMVLLTNNPVYLSLSFPDWEVKFIEPAARNVLQTARDSIHLGYKLTHHPLYGNFRPKHQPYRSILLAIPTAISSGVPPVDTMSLHLIEEALTVYAADKGMLPQDASPKMRHDCARLDFELMRTPLCQAGWSGEQWQEDWVCNFA